jgi:hypothetical protein
MAKIEKLKSGMFHNGGFFTAMLFTYEGGGEVCLFMLCY